MVYLTRDKRQHLPDSLLKSSPFFVCSGPWVLIWERTPDFEELSHIHRRNAHLVTSTESQQLTLWFWRPAHDSLRLPRILRLILHLVVLVRRRIDMIASD